MAYADIILQKQFQQEYKHNRKFIECECGKMIPQDCDVGKDYCRRCEHECKPSTI